MQSGQMQQQLQFWDFFKTLLTRHFFFHLSSRSLIKKFSFRSLKIDWILLYINVTEECFNNFSSFKWVFGKSMESLLSNFENKNYNSIQLFFVNYLNLLSRSIILYSFHYLDFLINKTYYEFKYYCNKLNLAESQRKTRFWVSMRGLNEILG